MSDPHVIETAFQCPACKYVPEIAARMTGKAAEPIPGAWAVCGRCATLLFMGDDRKFRRATRADVNTLSEDNARKLYFAIQAAEEAIAEGKRQ